MRILDPGPRALQRILQGFVLLQGHLEAPELLFGHPDQVLVAGEQLRAQTPLLPRAVAFLTEKLPSLGELIQRLSKENRNKEMNSDILEGRGVTNDC